MSNIIILDHSCPSIGYIARTVTAGDEIKMVRRYLSFIHDRAKTLKRKHVAVFVEPHIETGYPDLVIVEYYLPPKDIWCNARMTLSKTDLKILMHIVTSSDSWLKSSTLCELLGFEKDTVRHSLRKLSKCGLIYVSKSQETVRKVAINKWCRIKRIIAVEGKIDNWKRAIEQASRNTWFSTESFVLMNKDYCNQKVRDQCVEQGVGIILLNGEVEVALRGNTRPFPISYASLQFNEWIQRFMHSKE